MPIIELDFSTRLALLAAFSILVIAWSCRSKGGSRRRSEYLFLWFAAVVGAVFGAAVDLVTSSISPHYFIIGKELDLTHLRLDAALLGAQSGFSAGAVAAVVYLVACSWTRRRMPMHPRRLLRYLPTPIGAALVGAIVFGVTAYGWAPRDMLDLDLATEATRRLIGVWSAHAGLYLGGVLGLALGAHQIWAARSDSAHQAPTRAEQ